VGKVGGKRRRVIKATGVRVCRPGEEGRNVQNVQRARDGGGEDECCGSEGSGGGTGGRRRVSMRGWWSQREGA